MNDTRICSVTGCEQPSVITATLGIGPENELLTVRHEIACPLCADHRDARLIHGAPITLDYDKLYLPDEVRALIP